MGDELQENLVSGFRRLLPLLVSLFVLLLSYIPLNVGYFNNIRPMVGLACVYFWILNRSDIFNVFSVFILALVNDIISSGPFGSNLFAFLLMYILTANVQRLLNGKPFSLCWYGFMALSFAVFFAKWLVVSIYYRQAMPWAILLFSYSVTVAVYPFISLLFAFVQNKLIADEV